MSTSKKKFPRKLFALCLLRNLMNKSLLVKKNEKFYFKNFSFHCAATASDSGRKAWKGRFFIRNSFCRHGLKEIFPTASLLLSTDLTVGQKKPIHL